MIQTNLSFFVTGIKRKHSSFLQGATLLVGWWYWQCNKDYFFSNNNWSSWSRHWSGSTRYIFFNWLKKYESLCVFFFYFYLAFVSYIIFLLFFEKGQTHPFMFDKVFTPQSSQEEVFVEISQLVQSALDGYKVIIAYFPHRP